MRNGIIAAARYAVHDLRGMDNDAIVEQVLGEEHRRLEDDPRQSTHEDSPLPDTPEVRAVLDAVSAKMSDIDARLAPSPCWAHVLKPGESTMFHTHSAGFYPGVGLSWVYYASHPRGSGDLVFVCQLNDQRIYRRVAPAPGRLVIFSASMPHMTSRHAGEGVRVSLSGNYFLPLPTTLELLAKRTRSAVTEFSG